MPSKLNWVQQKDGDSERNDRFYKRDFKSISIDWDVSTKLKSRMECGLTESKLTLRVNEDW